jgi:hypothetical protein
MWRETLTVYFVAGTGGINVQEALTDIGAQVTEPPGSPGLSSSTVTYGNGLTSFGYGPVCASAQTLKIKFVRTVANHRCAFETVTIDLVSQRLVAP